MAFTPGTLVQQSLPPSPPNPGLPQIWGYYTTDNQATVSAADYFDLNPGYPIGRNTTWYVGDVINCVCSDGNVTLNVTAVTPHVTTAYPPADIAAGSITNAMLGAKVVNAAKIADATITATQIANTTITATQIANNTITATQIANNVITDTQVLANGLTGASLDLSVPRSVTISLTAAQFKALYDTPIQVVAAPGANKAIIVTNAALMMAFGAAQYTAGGAIALQYDSTIHGAGTAASATIAAATVNGWAASSGIVVAGALASTGLTTVANKGLYISNATADFATGDSTFKLTVNYYVVPTA